MTYYTQHLRVAIGKVPKNRIQRIFILKKQPNTLPVYKHVFVTIANVLVALTKLTKERTQESNKTKSQDNMNTFREHWLYYIITPGADRILHGYEYNGHVGKMGCGIQCNGVPGSRTFIGDSCHPTDP